MDNLAVTYNYTYTTTTTSSSLGAGFWIAYFIFLIAFWLVGGWVMGKVFKKAGRPAWAGFVPFYNSWLLLEMGGKSGANIFWVFLPFVGGIVFLVQYIIAMIEMGKRFGKSTVFSVFGLVIFSLIGFIILAFDKSQYQGPDAPVSGGPVPPQMPPQNTPPTPPAATPPAAPTA